MVVATDKPTLYAFIGRMTLTDYPPDVGGNFDTDAHRRVLGVLSHPDDNFGWNLAGIAQRVHPHIVFQSEDDVQLVVDDLVDSKFVEEPEPGFFRMTQAGFDELNGPNANEPATDDTSGEPVPAFVSTASSGSGLSTTFNGGSGDDSE